MGEMTTAEASERLGVSQRQIQRLIRVGEVPARRTAGDAWVLDALAVNALARSRPSRGRPWSPEAAWGALWMLSGLRATWVGARAESRAWSRLGALEPAALVHACRRRAHVRRCRVSDSFLDDLRGALVPSGASAAEQFGLSGETAQVEGYCDGATWAAILSKLRLAADPRGNATIRVTTVSEVLGVGLSAMPVAVVAADLAQSREARERSAGLAALADLQNELGLTE